MLSLHVTFKAFEPSVLKLVQNTLQSICTFIEKNPVNASLRVVKKPTLKKKFTVLRSPHVHKKSREQFIMQVYQTSFGISSKCSMFTKHYLTFACKNFIGAHTQMKHQISYKSSLWAK